MKKMRVSTLLSVAMAMAMTLLAANAEAQPVNFDNGNHINGAVPIPGTLLLFGGGWAAFAAWNWVRTRR